MASGLAARITRTVRNRRATTSGMPVDIFLVRHGQSEGNVAVHSSKRGDDQHMLNPEFRARHSSNWRLTLRGVKDADCAGRWLRENVPAREAGPLERLLIALGLRQPRPLFDRFYVSPYTRAMETAAHLDLPGADWKIDYRLRERERGVEDLLSSEERELFEESARDRARAPFWWRPLNGESIADVCMRVRDMLETLARDLPGGRVVIVCHGEHMEAFLMTITRMTPEEFRVWSDDPDNKIYNGQVMHFSRRDPNTGMIGRSLLWLRSIRTTDPDAAEPAWRHLKRPGYNNDELRTLAEQVPRIIEEGESR